MRTTTDQLPQAAKVRWRQRLLWFTGIYGVSVAAFAAGALLLQLLLPGAGAK